MRRHDTRRYLFYLFIAHEAAKTDTNKHSKPNTLPQSTNRNTTHTTNQTKNRKGIKTAKPHLLYKRKCHCETDQGTFCREAVWQKGGGRFDWQPRGESAHATDGGQLKATHARAAGTCRAKR